MCAARLQSELSGSTRGVRGQVMIAPESGQFTAFVASLVLLIVQERINQHSVG